MKVSSEEQGVYWLQQWGNSFTFGCEAPFQTPLQCDAIEHGLRIAFISVSRGNVARETMLADCLRRACIPALQRFA
jgi:hypothetical protein